MTNHFSQGKRCDLCLGPVLNSMRVLTCQECREKQRTRKILFAKERRKPMTQERIDSAAIQVTRAICQRTRWGLGYTSTDAVLRDVANGTINWNDVCDANVYQHEVLSAIGMIPFDVEELCESDRTTDVWNRVCDRWEWAADQVRRGRSN